MNDVGTTTEKATVRLERLLPGPIERVWAYLTEADKRATWFAGGMFDLRVGAGRTCISITRTSRRRRRPTSTRARRAIGPKRSHAWSLRASSATPSGPQARNRK